MALAVVAAIGLAAVIAVSPLIDWAIPFSRPARIVVAVTVLVPIGMALGIPMPAGVRLLSLRGAAMVPWAWGMNGAFSVLGATLAIFIAMNWGFRTTLVAASTSYLLGLAAFLLAARTSYPAQN